MATKRRKTKSRRRKSRKSCKYGKLKRPVRKRKCKKKSKKRRRSSKRKYRVGHLSCSGLRKTKNPKCEDQSNCKWVVGDGCKTTMSKKRKSTSKPVSTKFFKAIDLGRKQVVKTMLDKGFDINTTGGRYNMTPLILAAWRGNTSLVRLLIKRGANVNAQDIGGRTALMYASNKVMVKALLDAGADKTIRSNDGKTALDFAKTDDGSGGDPIDPQIIRLLSSSGSTFRPTPPPTPNKVRLSITELKQLTKEINVLENKYDMTPKDEYRKYSRYLSMRDLGNIEQGIKSLILLVLPDMSIMSLSMNNVKKLPFYPASEYGDNLWGETVLSNTAVLGGFPDKFVIVNDSVIDYLERRLNTLKTYTPQRNVGNLACSGLRKTKNPKCEDQSNCKWVVGDGCKNKRKNRFAYTAKYLQDAAARRRAFASDPAFQTDMYERLLEAVWRQDNDTVYDWLERRNADVNYKYGEDGSTLLMIATGTKNINLMDRLIYDYGANPNIINDDGNTVLHQAVNDDVNGNNIMELNVLIDGGADPSIRDRDGYTALDNARRYNKTDMIIVLERFIQPSLRQTEL
jgi:ankyrin repeat protein